LQCDSEETDESSNSLRALRFLVTTANRS
jgi:hypothetical protein